MGYSMGQVAAFAGVTVRTLHHYDEIVPLSPSSRSHAGHRRYDDADLDRSRQILFYRELGFPLDEVAALLDDPDADPREHVRGRRDRDPRERRPPRVGPGRRPSGGNGGVGRSRRTHFGPGGRRVWPGPTGWNLKQWPSVDSVGQSNIADRGWTTPNSDGRSGDRPTIHSGARTS